MIPEAKISEFVARLREGAGTNLLSVVLYGSAAADDYVDDLSDVNLLCVLGETSFASLSRLAPSIASWVKAGNRPPLLMGREELQRSADVFSIELLDMQQRHRLLWGEDPLNALAVPTGFHRAQVEYELREKTILLRQSMLMASGNEAAMWELLLRSLPAFATLFRHALLELGEPATGSKRETMQKLAQKIGFNASSFLELLDVRELKKDRKSANVQHLFAEYLKDVEMVTAAVDRMLDSPAA